MNKPSSFARRISVLAIALSLALVTACGDDDDKSGGSGGGDGCSSLCTGAGLSGGTATTFGGDVTECVCTGTGKGIAKSACEAYCAPLNVPAAKSFLSTNANPDDKCVCDGT